MGYHQVQHRSQARGRATFLDVPPRSSKPRTAGVTHVLDLGRPLPALRDLLDSTAWVVDLWKFGFGTAYVDPQIADKVAVLHAHEVTACVGGTLLEASWLQDRVVECLDWAADVGFACVEVSNGATRMSPEDKRHLIKLAATQFTVLAEVGTKETQAPVDASAWRDETMADVAAGARFAIAEGRSTGTVGLYEPDGSVRADVVNELVSGVGVAQLIFEAPRSTQQAWFVRRFGAEVNLGNVAPGDLLAVEALRVGLRADTLPAVPQRPGRRGHP